MWMIQGSINSVIAQQGSSSVLKAIELVFLLRLLLLGFLYCSWALSEMAAFLRARKYVRCVVRFSDREL